MRDNLFKRGKLEGEEMQEREQSMEEQVSVIYWQAVGKDTDAS